MSTILPDARAFRAIGAMSEESSDGTSAGAALRSAARLAGFGEVTLPEAFG